MKTKPTIAIYQGQSLAPLPCPFCGGGPNHGFRRLSWGGQGHNQRQYYNNQRQYYIECTCPVGPKIIRIANKDEVKQDAIDIWNTRA